MAKENQGYDLSGYINSLPQTDQTVGEYNLSGEELSSLRTFWSEQINVIVGHSSQLNRHLLKLVFGKVASEVGKRFNIQCVVRSCESIHDDAELNQKNSQQAGAERAIRFSQIDSISAVLYLTEEGITLLWEGEE